MAIEEPTNRHANALQSLDTGKLLPGTSIPTGDGTVKQRPLESSSGHSPKSEPGPEINGRPTTVTLYEPSDLVDSPLLPSIRKLINEAFSLSHEKDGHLPGSIQRLQKEDQYLIELGNAPGTFTYIITYASGNEHEVLATASAKQFHGAPKVVQGVDSLQKQTFKRKAAASANDEEWELSLMAVLPTLQRQGLSGVLMRSVEEEVTQRFSVARGEDGGARGLVMLLTTLKEINEVFYAKRGYGVDYETKHAIGHMGSEKGFGVVHMSKRVM